MESTIFGNEIEYLLSNDDFPREFTSQVQAIPYICVKKKYSLVHEYTKCHNNWILVESSYYLWLFSICSPQRNSSPTDRFLKRQVCYQGWFSLGVSRLPDSKLLPYLWYLVLSIEILIDIDN